jgi:hypothetical protein
VISVPCWFTDAQVKRLQFGVSNFVFENNLVVHSGEEFWMLQRLQA